MGLRSFFSGTEFQIVGEATNGLDLIQGVERSCPHLVLIDTNQMSFQGFTEDLLKGPPKHCRWRFKVVPFSSSLKSVSKHRLLEKIRQIAPNPDAKIDSAKSNRLTSREIEILRLIVQGQCNKEIAKSLGIALDTVKEHVQNILRKTSQSDRTQAALWAVRNEIVSL